MKFHRAKQHRPHTKREEPQRQRAGHGSHENPQPRRQIHPVFLFLLHLLQPPKTDSAAPINISPYAAHPTRATFHVEPALGTFPKCCPWRKASKLPPEAIGKIPFILINPTSPVFRGALELLIVGHS